MRVQDPRLLPFYHKSLPNGRHGVRMVIPSNLIRKNETLPLLKHSNRSKRQDTGDTHAVYQDASSSQRLYQMKLLMQDIRRILASLRDGSIVECSRVMSLTRTMRIGGSTPSGRLHLSLDVIIARTVEVLTFYRRQLMPQRKNLRRQAILLGKCLGDRLTLLHM